MAAALEHGSQPAQPAAMSSFCNMNNIEHGQTLPSTMHQEFVLDGNGDSSDRNAKVHSCNLDGTNDRSKDNPFTRSKTGLQRSTAQVTGSHVHPAARTPENPKKAQHTDDTFSGDADLSSNPRKRRRISPVNDASDFMSGQSLGSFDASTVAQAHSAQFTASIRGPDQSTEIHSLGQTSQNAVANPSKTIITTPVKRASRKKRVEDRSSAGDILEHLSSTESATTSTPSKIKKRTPRKRNLSLHTNGKLLSSPTIDSLLPDNTHNAENKHATSKRNYQMRNGKFVQTLEVVLRYGSDQKNRQAIGKRIDDVLSQTKGVVQTEAKGASSTTHPFFLGKVKPKPQSNDLGQSHGEITDNESGSRKQEPVAWKDIKFSSLKPTIWKFIESIPPAWPPLSFQHVGNELPTSYSSKTEAGECNKAKLKSRVVQLKDDENVLNEYLKDIKKVMPASHTVGIPQRICLSGAKVTADLQSLSVTPYTHDAISSVRSAITQGLSAFDRGEYAGPNMWTAQYVPLRWSEVLQPSASVLHQWLQGLAIHNVKSGVDMNGSVRRSKGPIKKKRRKPKNELDEFIVNSDEDGDLEKSSKTAILIVGPNGCGKTASVFAIAKELGFEVFEIHSGMRRTAKDIFDKVGDMAHNHLVQKGTDLSRSSSIALSGADTDIDTDTDSKQTSVAGLLRAKQSVKLPPNDSSKTNRGKKEQKQSLILFEEVDQLFEDDKGFWSGVQSLIKHSKRPVVLTCNDSSSVPVEDLDLYDILTYEPVDQELATDYLVHLAAAEGHILDREAVSTLYTLKRHDLRASITELNLWCQMTVGSKQGGLDWMTQTSSRQPKVDHDGNRLRIFSQGTFQKALDLVPQIIADGEAAIRFAQDSLGIAPSNWCDFGSEEVRFDFDVCDSNLQVLSRLESIADARSAIDLLDDTAAPALALATASLNRNQNPATNRDLIALHYMQQLGDVSCQRKTIMDAFVPIMTEKPTFPPSLGRLAPSIDTCTSVVSTEIAPYVRSIVEFDQRLERQRDEVFGSQGKARKTRAARAAAEGGDKASTRSERWFPKDLDFEKVMRTGGPWPRWYEDEQMAQGSDTTSSSPSASASA